MRQAFRITAEDALCIHHIAAGHATMFIDDLRCRLMPVCMLSHSCGRVWEIKLRGSSGASKAYLLTQQPLLQMTCHRRMVGALLL